jgi:hypothetical protein
MELETRNEPYIYEALSYEVHPHPIRLLKISPGEPGSRICCELFPTYLTTSQKAGDDWDWETISDSSSGSTSGSTGREESDIEDNPRYTALSYVWGDQADTVTIHIYGKELSVTGNLFKLLECHREFFLENRRTEALFWIDAICIDQSNIGERSKQVAFMAEIYKIAQNVLAWLGGETEYTEPAFKILQRVVAEHKISDPAKLSDQEAATCSMISEGGWFDRLWVVQEAVHARSLIVRCGKFEISWEGLKKIAGWQDRSFISFELMAGFREDSHWTSLMY